MDEYSSFWAPFEPLSCNFDFVPHLSLKSPRRSPFPHQLGPNVQSWFKALVGGLAFFFPPHHLLSMLFGILAGGEEEATRHLVKCGAAWVFNPNNTTFGLMDTAKSAHFVP